MEQQTKYTVDWFNKSLAPQIQTMNKLLGGDANVAKELAFAAQIINGNDYLKKCTAGSILKAVFNISGTSLTLNPVLGYAYLVPRKMNGVWECCLQPGYQGLIKLLTDGGAVKAIRAHTVYHNDVFDYEFGTQWHIKYKPTLEKNKGDMVAVFAIATIEGGIEQPMLMSAHEIYEIRELSQSWLSQGAKSIWGKNEGEMACKTVIRRMQKYLPKSTKTEQQLARVLELDNEDFTPSESQVVYMENLIETSAYDHETRQILIDKLNAGISVMEYNTMLRDLKDNQLDPVQQSGMATQTQIGNHLDKIAGDNRKLL